jgi:hypothetical protein
MGVALYGNEPSACTLALAGTFNSIFASAPVLANGVQVYYDALRLFPVQSNYSITTGNASPIWYIGSGGNIVGSVGTCTTPTTTTTSTSTSTTSTSTSTSTSTTTSTSTSTSTTTAAPTTTSTSTTTTIAPIPLVTEGLIIWNNYTDYTGYGTAIADRSGNGNTALVSGSTMVPTGSIGLAFDGTGNYFTYPEPVNNTPTGSYTLQFYGTIQIESLNRDFFCKEDFDNGWDYVITPYPEIVYRQFNSGDSSLDGPIANMPIKLITITADIAGVLKLYIDSTLIKTNNPVVEAFNSGTGVKFKFGFNTQPDGTYFKGSFKDIILYNRVLSADEVLFNYAYLSGSPITTTTSGPTTTTTTIAPVVTNGLVAWQNYQTYTSGDATWANSGPGNEGNFAIFNGSTQALSGSLGIAFNGTNNYLTYNDFGGGPNDIYTMQMYGTFPIDAYPFANYDLWTNDNYTDGWDTIYSSEGKAIYRDTNQKQIDLGASKPPGAALRLLTLVCTQYDNNVKVYINTTEVGNMTSGSVAQWFQQDGVPQFGWNANTDAGYFKGTVKQLLVYYTALSQEDITFNYNGLSAL